MQNTQSLWIGIAVIVALVAGTLVYLQYGQGLLPTIQKPQIQGTSGKVWGIGVLLWDDPVYSELGPFKQKMEELGRKEGIDVVYTVKNAKADGSVSKQHADELFADDSIDIILSLERSFRSLDKTNFEGGVFPKPVIYSNVPDFVRLGVRGQYSPTMHAGFNFTGVVCGNVEFAERRMTLLKDIIPDAKVFGIILNPESASYEVVKTLHQNAAQKLGVELKIIESTNVNELLARAKAEFRKNAVDGVLRTTDTGMTSRENNELVAHFIEAGVPYVSWDHTTTGADSYIATVSNDPPQQARQAASMVHKFMSGVPLDNIPVEFSENLGVHLNTAIAEKAGIEIPENVLLRATVINTRM